MVLISNAIQRTDATDLRSLTDFVTSLESCRGYSEGAEKLYKMCVLFLKVAGFYIQAKYQERQTAHMPSFSGSEQRYNNTANTGTPIDLSAIAQFGPHLSALGFLSNPTWSTAEYTSDPAALGQGFYAPDLGANDTLGDDGLGSGYNAGDASQIQNWFSGSRYLRSFVDGGNDMEMPDFNFDVGLY